MALELISYFEIESNKRIILPRHSNVYKINLDNWKVEFYRDNPGINVLELNTWKIDKNAREIEFELREDKIGGYILIPRFYESNGKLLKIGNR